MRFLNRLFSFESDESGYEEKKGRYISLPDDEADRLWELLQDPVLRRRLERYFARLWQVYPEGVIVRLNTGHKKLAERGAALRREIGFEGNLDGFFALGGFTYQRSVGGRPSPVLTEQSKEKLLHDLKEEFPDGVPTVAAVKETNHRLYLNLRAVARKQACTMSEYLQRHGLMKAKKGVVWDGAQ